MEWDDLKEGMIIRWNPVFIESFDPIIILLGAKGIQNHLPYQYEGIQCQILSGTSYSYEVYQELFVSNHDYFCTVTIYRSKFEKYKNDIIVSTQDDFKYIENRMNSHIESYKRGYEEQKIWAEDLIQKAEKFYNCDLKVKETS